VSRLVTESALMRKGSVGAHYRSDYPERGESGKQHILVQKEDERIRYEFAG